MVRYIMKIAPLSYEVESFSRYIVFPGNEGKTLFFAPDDKSALDQILYEYPLAELTAEEPLQDVAKDYNLPVRPLSETAAHGLSLFVLDLLHGEPYQHITEDGLVYRFCQVVREFRRFSRDHNSIDRVKLQISGSISFQTNVYLFPTGNDGVFIVILMEIPVKHGTSGRLEPDDLVETDRIWAEVHSGPESILDALRRAHSLDVIPIPYQRSHGVDGKVQDMHLAVLISTLSAISSLKDGNEVATSEFKIAGYEINATVERL